MVRLLGTWELLGAAFPGAMPHDRCPFALPDPPPAPPPSPPQGLQQKRLQKGAQSRLNEFSDRIRNTPSPDLSAQVGVRGGPCMACVCQWWSVWRLKVACALRLHASLCTKPQPACARQVWTRTKQGAAALPLVLTELPCGLRGCSAAARSSWGAPDGPCKHSPVSPAPPVRRI